MAEKSLKQFRLKILKINETLFDGEVTQVTLPGIGGEITVLLDHEPLVTLLQSGEIIANQVEGETKTFSIDRGYFEVSNNLVSVLLT